MGLIRSIGFSVITNILRTCISCSRSMLSISSSSLDLTSWLRSSGGGLICDAWLPPTINGVYASYLADLDLLRGDCDYRYRGLSECSPRIWFEGLCLWNIRWTSCAALVEALGRWLKKQTSSLLLKSSWSPYAKDGRFLAEGLYTLKLGWYYGLNEYV